MNTMQSIKVEKITLNIGVGSPGDKLEKAMKLLKSITKAQPVHAITMKRIPTWGVRPKLAIACKVTLRGKSAEAVLDRLLRAVDNTLPASKFDISGNFSFGIKEYIDIPDVPYDVSIGIIGLEAAVTLQRPGFRIKRRLAHSAKLPQRHRISKDDAIAFMKEKFHLSVGGEQA
ncbi:50S ribosomal protein L5 [Candidatus Woesearchaeota archaeon]|nr:50S ribosomal protein L5 [Candidatus Woesearchaeota archaeon]